jgi:hypothetical protein
MKIKLLTDPVACEQQYCEQLRGSNQAFEYIRLIEPLELVSGNKLKITGIWHLRNKYAYWARGKYISYHKFSGYIELPELDAESLNCLTRDVGWLILSKNTSLRKAYAKVYTNTYKRYDFSSTLTIKPSDSIWVYKPPVAVVFDCNTDGYCSAFASLDKYRMFGALYSDSQQAHGFGIYDGSFETVEHVKNCLSIGVSLGMGNYNRFWKWRLIMGAAILSGNAPQEEEYQTAVWDIRNAMPTTIEDYIVLEGKGWYRK